MLYEWKIRKIQKANASLIYAFCDEMIKMVVSRNCNEYLFGSD